MGWFVAWGIVLEHGFVGGYNLGKFEQVSRNSTCPFEHIPSEGTVTYEVSQVHVFSVVSFWRFCFLGGSPAC